MVAADSCRRIWQFNFVSEVIFLRAPRLFSIGCAYDDPIILSVYKTEVMVVEAENILLYGNNRRADGI